MRWLIGLLVLANLVLLLWGGVRPASQQRSPDPPPDVGEIRLLRAAPDAVAVTEPRPTAPGSGAAEQPEPVVLEPEEQAPDNLAADIEASPPTPVVEPVMVCGELGGFDDGDSAAALAEQLRSSGVQAELIEDVRQEQTGGHWALIPPAPDRATARAHVAKLQAAEIEDIWLIPKGPMQNAISLGLFSTAARAERRVRQIRALGLAAEVRLKVNETRSYRIGYRTNERRAASLKVAATAHAGIAHRIVPCPAIAPPGGVP